MHKNPRPYISLSFPLSRSHMGLHCTTQGSKITHKLILMPLPAAFPRDEASFSLVFPSQTRGEAGLPQPALFWEESGTEKAR